MKQPRFPKRSARRIKHLKEAVRLHMLVCLGMF